MRGFSSLRNIWSVDVRKISEQKDETGPMVLAKFGVDINIYHGSHYVKAGQYVVEIEVYYAPKSVSNTRSTKIWYRAVGEDSIEETIWENREQQTVVKVTA
jgi:hypothetical protein